MNNQVETKGGWNGDVTKEEPSQAKVVKGVCAFANMDSDVRLIYLGGYYE